MGKNRKDEYLTTTVKALFGKRKVAKLVAAGWEVLPANTGGIYNPAITLRKPNPNYRPPKR